MMPVGLAVVDIEATGEDIPQLEIDTYTPSASFFPRDGGLFVATLIVTRVGFAIEVADSANVISIDCWIVVIECVLVTKNTP